MSIIDDFIRDEINTTRSRKRLEWMAEIVQLNHGEMNPFLTSTGRSGISESEMASHPIGQLFYEPGCEMVIYFPDETNSTGTRETSFMATLKSMKKTFSKEQMALRERANYHFNTLSSSGFFTSAAVPANHKRFSFRISTFDCKFSVIEPVICSGFLFDQSTGEIISEQWNFIPDASARLFRENHIECEENTTASFEIDPTRLTEETYFVIILSHPLSVDEGASVIKYYTTPSTSHEQAAIKKVRQSFPRSKLVFTTFAWTFIKFSELRSSKTEVVFASPFLTDSAFSEKVISDRLEDPDGKKSKQILMKIGLTRIEDSMMLIRPIAVEHPLPLLSPTHQLAVTLKSLSLKLLPGLKSRNLLISVEVKSIGGAKIKCIHSELTPSKFVDSECSRCFYHDRTPTYDDVFLIDLPFPCPKDLSLIFNLWHVHVKQNEDPTFVGQAVLPIYRKRSGLVQKDGLKTITMEMINNGKTSSDKSNKLTISTYLRSNISTNNRAYMELMQCGDNLAEFTRILKKLPDRVIVSQINVILDQIICVYDANTEISFEPLTIIRNACLNIVSPAQFEKFIMLYVRYFAFKHAGSDDHEEPISLLEHNPKRNTARNGLRKSSSLIDIQKFDTLCENAQPGAADDNEMVDSLLDFNIRSSTILQIEDSLTAPIYEKLMTCFVTTVKESGLNTLEYMQDFICSLIIKSMAISKTKTIPKGYDDFIRTFCEEIVSNPGQVQSYSRCFGLFINLLFDIGFASASAKATHILTDMCLQSDSYSTLVAYTRYAFRPTLFLYSLQYIDEFRSSVMKMLQEATKPKAKQETQEFFEVLLHIFSSYDEEMCVKVASIVIDCIHNVNTTMLPEISNVMTQIAFFNFLFEFADATTLKRFADAGKSEVLFKLCHFIIGRITPYEMKNARKRQHTVIERNTPDRKQTKPLMKPPAPRARGTSVRCRRGSGDKRPPSLSLIANAPPSVNEIVASTHAAMFKFASTFISIGDVDIAEGLLGFTHHIMCLQMNYINYPILFNLIAEIADKFAPKIFNARAPCWAKIIDRIFTLASELSTASGITRPIEALFTADLRTNQNNNRMTVLFARNLSMLSPERLMNEQFAKFMEDLSETENKALRDMINTYASLKNITSRMRSDKLSIHERAELLMERVFALRNTPDGQFAALNDLSEFHLLHNNKREALNVKILQAAIILEYSVISGKMTDKTSFDHPAMEFSSNCLLCKYISCATHLLQDLPIIPSWADSQPFSDLGFIALIHEIIDIAVSSSIYEPAVAMLDIIWPLLEKRRLYEQLEEVFELTNKVFTSAAALPPHSSDAMTDTYFRVSFHGSLFGDAGGKQFIYCEKRLTHLFSFSQSFVQSYKDIYGQDNIQLLSDSGAINEDDLDNDKGYIRITYVQPYYGKKAASSSTLGITPTCNCFFFDTPFVKGSKKLQGSLETQWIRRTILTSQFSLPTIVARARVASSSEIEYSPIRVAYRAIRDRVESFQKAINSKDFREIGQLLHGSLLAQVNEGPLKIAEVFLSNSDESKESAKMKFEFDRFAKVLTKAMKLHSEFVAAAPEWLPLHVELEISLDAFVKSLSTYLQ